MSKFVVAYRGGAMAGTPEEQQEVMQRWMEWFGSIQSSVTDLGNPFGASSVIGPDGSVSTSTGELGGYSILEADSLEAASKLVAGCPVLAVGGSVEVYEALEM
jgi:hypothetical protein